MITFDETTAPKPANPMELQNAIDQLYKAAAVDGTEQPETLAALDTIVSVLRANSWIYGNPTESGDFIAASISTEDSPTPSVVTVSVLSFYLPDEEQDSDLFEPWSYPTSGIPVMYEKVYAHMPNPVPPPVM